MFLHVCGLFPGINIYPDSRPHELRLFALCVLSWFAVLGVLDESVVCHLALQRSHFF